MSDKWNRVLNSMKTKLKVLERLRILRWIATEVNVKSVLTRQL